MTRTSRAVVTIHPRAGTDFPAAVKLLWDGQVPTAELVGETFELERVGEALALLDRRTADRDAVRVGLRLAP